MATTAATLAAERWLDEVILSAAVADVAGGNLDESLSLPAGLGDVAILSVMVSITSIATVPVTATIPRGVSATITSADAASLVDVVGAAEWVATEGLAAAFTRARAFIDADALTLWRQGELLRLLGPEMDANASPTGDFAVHVKCVRVRPVALPVGPIQLVR